MNRAAAVYGYRYLMNSLIPPVLSGSEEIEPVKIRIKHVKFSESMLQLL
jgi:hypothetical protein